MDAQVINFKRYDSGAMIGFFDLVVGGITVTSCKAFRKEDKVWFAWPAEKSQDKEGKDYWREIVTASEPVMRHLQNLVRGQLRALLDGGNGPVRKPSPGRPAQRGFRTPEGEDLSEYKSTGKADDIPF
jgi:hypothetical protein